MASAAVGRCGAIVTRLLTARFPGRQKTPSVISTWLFHQQTTGMLIHRFCGERTIRDAGDEKLRGLLQTPVQAKVPICENLPEENVFSIVQAAGWPIWPLLLASIIAVALILERLVALRRSKVVPPGLLQRVVAEYRQNGVTAAMVGDLEAHSPLGRVLGAGLRNVGSSREIMKEAIEEAGGVVSHNLERYLTTLGTIASISPLMGLFGTVVGMIEIFGSQAPSGSNPIQLAHGISVALYNTGFGLLIAIPSMIFWRHFRALVDSFVVEMQQQAVRLVEVLHGQRSS
ncbi:MAG: Biopolymer transport protein ExbB [Candidatus Accumulibacter vicinus]|uniref:Biopolymer transport protein ExbB n=1 Tax=Candidatus Accumulibacter vicinus TaxID=2954382 RepID=A0A084Y048_9PROT|nr:MAG: Biopolymer transport protein ExbB [Candidatus Accumulibacter vicinus]